MSRIDQMEEKLDLLIRLTEAQDEKIKGLTDKVGLMAPTVQQVADAVTFAKVGKSVFRVFMGVGMVVGPIIWWLNDKWSIIAQIFKRVP